MATKAQQIELLASGILFDAELLTTPYAKFLAAGTTTAKTAWDDANKAVAITKKALNSQGRAIVYGDGVYKIQIYDGDPDAGGVLKFEIDNYKVIALIGNTRTITTDTTGSTDDSLVKIDTTSGNVTYTLPDAALMAGQLLQVVKSVAANTATIAAASGQTVNGAASVSLTKAFSSGTFQSDGTSWFSTSDAASVAGFVPDTGTTAGTIPVRDGSGDLPGNILGNAASVTFRGALAYNNSGTNPVLWANEAYDTDAIHDTSTNTGRLTVPAGVSRVRLHAQITYGVTPGTLYINKNSSATSYPGKVTISFPASERKHVQTATVSVVPGDFFFVEVTQPIVSDSTGDVNWFAMEIIE